MSCGDRLQANPYFDITDRSPPDTPFTCGIIHVELDGQGLHSLFYPASDLSVPRRITYFNIPQLAPQGFVSKPHSLS